MNILLLQLDGGLPNIALMRIAAHHHALGDHVELRRARAKTERSAMPQHQIIFARLVGVSTDCCGAGAVIEKSPSAITADIFCGACLGQVSFVALLYGRLGFLVLGPTWPWAAPQTKPPSVSTREEST
jgi:hypothetical protein